MPSVWGSACGSLHVVGAGPTGNKLAVVWIIAPYDVTVAFAFGAVIEMSTSGVVRSPGTAFGVESVTVASEEKVPLFVPAVPGLPSVFTVPNTVGFPGCVPVPITVNWVGEGIDATLRFAVGSFPPEGGLPEAGTFWPT